MDWKPSPHLIPEETWHSVTESCHGHTDSSVGQTRVSAHLLAKLEAHALRYAAMVPLATSRLNCLCWR